MEILRKFRSIIAKFAGEESAIATFSGRGLPQAPVEITIFQQYLARSVLGKAGATLHVNGW